MSIVRFAVPGSAREPRPDARLSGTPNPADTISVTLMLRRRAPLDPLRREPPIAREAFAARYGADPGDVRRVEAFAQQFDLTVVSIDLARRTVRLSGTIANMNEAFGTTLQLYQCAHGVYRGRTGALFLPGDLQDVVVGVFGLDNRPQASVRCRRHRRVAGAAAAGDTSYTPVEIARLYGYPADLTGAGQTVAIVELGGGYSLADLQAYFTRLGTPLPSVTAVSVDGGQNTPAGDPNSADGEVLLDVEIVGAIAPGARIAVYFAPNTDEGFLDAITTAVHDAVRRPSVVSISWGAAESAWTGQSLDAYDQAFQDAAAVGVTVCCASGDSGSSDGENDGQAHVDFPASSPHVLACGGTRIQTAGQALAGEVVWSDAGGGATGGGVSEVFALPAYQAAANVPVSVNPTRFKGRGVPDVAGDADPATGYDVRVDGHDVVYGGTSAVAPLWAALVALINERRGTALGYLNPLLYALKPGAFRDITSGANGAYRAGPGWDTCTGFGSPDGAKLTAALGATGTAS